MGMYSKENLQEGNEGVEVTITMTADSRLIVEITEEKGMFMCAGD